MAFVFGSGATGADEDMYPYLDEGADVPLSPDDQALLLGVYPATTMTDFDFAMMMQQQQQQQQPPPPMASASMNPAMSMMMTSSGMPAMAMTTATERQKVSGRMPTSNTSASTHHIASTASGTASMQQQQQQHASFLYDTKMFGDALGHASATQSHQQQHSHGTYALNTANCSPVSTTSSADLPIRDSEEILNAPVKSLTDEEKKLRRRAQVAKSARKHRNRQKEELARLREQVLQLQEQMARMKQGQSSASGESGEHEREVITMHRKRKKVDEPELTLEGALKDQQGFATAVQKVLDKNMAIQHWFHRLPVDESQRAKMLHQIASKRFSLALLYVENEFDDKRISYPHMDIKLNCNGPDMEIKLVRAKEVRGFTYLEVADAAWSSVFNFQLDIPDRFKPYVTCERLMELDENTRYGRTIAPLLKLREENVIVYLHSYFLVRREVMESRVLITWESIDMDDLYPFEMSDTKLCNDEIGCILLEKGFHANGEEMTVFRSVIHSTPPVPAIAEPRGKINESFLTAFCRSADILEKSARNRLRRAYPDRYEALRQQLRAEAEQLQ